MIFMPELDFGDYFQYTSRKNIQFRLFYNSHMILTEWLTLCLIKPEWLTFRQKINFQKLETKRKN